MAPTADEQIRFLVNLQRLLDEGQFVASYKFALLLALGDLSIEKGDDSGAPLTISTPEIGAKFIQYYWRQVIPYVNPERACVLQQNTGRQAAIVNIVQKAREQQGNSLAAVMNRPAAWKQLVREVSKVVKVMPLWKLQRLGRERLEFLYRNLDTGNFVELLPGVVYCFRKFHALISDLVRGAWVRYVRQQNLGLIGEAADLNEFLFGSERSPLVLVQPVLLDLQRGRCFYCQAQLNSAQTHVDHFIAWARYPVDLGHNFVLADSRCNSKKRDRLPAYEHLVAWTERNSTFGDQIGVALEERGIIARLPASKQVAHWAYAQTEAAGGLTWLRADEMVPLKAEWRELLR
jgi:hypothetical protein